MARTHAFDENRDQYENWFNAHPLEYESELEAIRGILPKGQGVEIGVGTGRFASKLGIKDGVEPSSVMADEARKRGIHVAIARAEQCPFKDEAFSFSLMVTTLCFVEDPKAAIREMKRLTKAGGLVIQAFVDRESPLGKIYEAKKASSVFYRDATFHSAAEIIALLEGEGLRISSVTQTLFGNPGDITTVQAPQVGHGQGGFVVIAARKA